MTDFPIPFFRLALATSAASLLCSTSVAQDAGKILAQMRAKHVALLPHVRTISDVEVDRQRWPKAHGELFYVSPRRFVVRIHDGYTPLSYGCWGDAAWFYSGEKAPQVEKGAKADAARLLFVPHHWYSPGSFSDAKFLQGHNGHQFFTMRGAGHAWTAMIEQKSGLLRSLNAKKIGSVNLQTFQVVDGCSQEKRVYVRYEKPFGPVTATRKIRFVLGARKAAELAALSARAEKAIPAAVRRQLGGESGATAESKESKESKVSKESKTPQPTTVSMPKSLRARIRRGGLAGQRSAARAAYIRFWQQRSGRIRLMRNSIEGAKRNIRTLEARGLSTTRVKASMVKFEKDLAELERPVPVTEIVKFLAADRRNRSYPYTQVLADLRGGENPERVSRRLQRFVDGLARLPDSGASDNARIKEHVLAVRSAIEAIKEDKLDEAQASLDGVWSWVLASE